MHSNFHFLKTKFPAFFQRAEKAEQLIMLMNREL